MESTARTAVQLLYCKLQISTPLGFIGIPLESVRLLGCTLQLGGLHLFKQLALGSRDLSQAEKKVDIVKPEQIHKITSIFAQNGQK